MKLLADENFLPTLISHLQKQLHSVKRVQKSAKSISDPDVSELARKESRVIITFDRDFLKLPLNENSPSVMIFSFPKFLPEEIAPFLSEIMSSISRLKRKKKPFHAVFSEKGLDIK